MIGIPTMYWATLIAVVISIILLVKVWTLSRLLQNKDMEIKYQTQVKEIYHDACCASSAEINAKSQLIKYLEDNIRHLREIKERREHE